MAQIITPPIRTSLMTQNGVPFSTENGDIQTTRDWWLYWNRLGDQANLSSLQANQGLHSDRPIPDNMPDGAIYVESDRGVIYQLQGGDWVYVAGTMYGTISPDQRPTDLGPNDGGFAFTATDPLASDTGRTFAWSGTAWVETSQVLYGTHANRPLPAAAPARCIYVEADRGPTFQNQLGQWVYLAGTMWGTLSPDQRPTDLGMFDAGFNFRTNVAPPQEFIWSGTAWVDVTPQTGDVQIAYATADLTLVDSVLNDVPGASLTLARAGRYLITGNFLCFEHGAGDVGVIMYGVVVLDGTAQSPGVLFAASALEQLASLSNQWVYTAPAAGAIVKLQAQKYGGGGTSTISSVHTSISALWVSS